jgi:excisionase family DNA binding protein
MQQPPVTLSVLDAAEATGLGRSTIAAAVASGQLPAHKHGARVLITQESLTAWVASLPLHKGARSATTGGAK